MTDLQDDLTVAEEVVEEIAPLRLRFKAIDWNAKSYDSLVLREPDVSDLLEARKKADPIEQGVTLLQRVCGLPMQVVIKLPQRVLERAADYFAPFTSPSPDTAGGN
jgi:hypothetical protein